MPSLPDPKSFSTTRVVALAKALVAEAELADHPQVVLSWLYGFLARKGGGQVVVLPLGVDPLARLHALSPLLRQVSRQGWSSRYPEAFAAELDRLVADLSGERT